MSLLHDSPTAASQVAGLAIRPAFFGLGEPFVVPVEPTPLPEPSLIAYNVRLGRELGFDDAIARDPAFLRIVAGNARFRDVAPVASVYAGHQFGQWAGQLGDGRAIALGSLRAPDGRDWEWQLKGAGPTPYSRSGDGRAVLRSTIREYLASEALHALGIPTTRALAIAASPEPVYRERVETAAVLSRLAPSHLRFGHFEFYANAGRTDDLRRLADVTIERFYPEAAAATDPYAALLRAVATRTAELVASWQAVGFAHGVLNTDNLSMLGLTIDYGPYGWVEAYDPNFICNHSDHSGRYAFGAQPSIGFWNLRALGAALRPLSSEVAIGEALAAYPETYNAAFPARLRQKFGLAGEHADDLALFTEALELLLADRVDYTRFFRALSSIERRSSTADDALGAWFVSHDRLAVWLARYRERLATGPRTDAERGRAMDAVNPLYVLRNHLAQAAIERAETGDFAEIARLADVLARPFEERAGLARDAEPRPPNVADVAVSCSS